MKCVACDSQLVPDLHEGLEVLSCPNGDGTFLPGDTLLAVVRRRVEDRPVGEEDEALAESASTALDSSPESVRTCPVCGGAMNKLTYAYQSGVIIDTCPADGVWVDTGELRRIEAWVEGSERLAASERAQWQPQLDQLERAQDQSLAREEGSVHSRFGGMFVTSLSSWWFARNDASRNRR